MEVKIKGKRLTVSKLLKKDETYKITRNKGMFQLAIYKKPQVVRGFNSLCSDMKHVLFIDYDNVCRWIVEKELDILARRYPPFYLFTTKEDKGIGNYHAICLGKFYPNEIVTILSTTSCDNAYRTIPLRNVYRSWTLRASNKIGSNKPRFIKTIGDINIDMNISTAHLNALKTLYPKIQHPNYLNQDHLTELICETYETRK